MRSSVEDYGVDDKRQQQVAIQNRRGIDRPTRFNSNGTCVSGLSNVDYADLGAMGVDVQEFVMKSRIPLPQELVDQFPHMQCNCGLGIFPEISRVWLTIDSDLFVWNYENNSDLAYFDGLTSAILKLGLAKPKTGVFQSHVHYLLVAATAADLVLLAISFSDQQTNCPVSSASLFSQADMHLMPEPLYKLPLDGAIVADIACTQEGRIFLACRDGCLYEIDYYDKGWFRRQCKKINHSKGIMSYLVPSFVAFTFGRDEPLVQISIDETRRILFTRSDKGSIQVFDLGSDGKQMSKVTSVSAEAIEHYASGACDTVEPSNFRPIVHIAAVPSTSSQTVNVQATSHAGLRLYFSCYYRSAISVPNPHKQEVSQEDVRPVTLRLVHIRLPPGFSAGSSIQRPLRLHLACFSNDWVGFLTCADEDNDTFWAFSETNFPFRSDFVETTTQLLIRGRTWAIAEMRNPFDIETYETALTRQRPNSVLPARPPLCVYQHIEQAKKIAILTIQGVHLVEEKRPVDLLREMLEEKGADAIQIRAFMALHDPDNSAAMCLLLMASAETRVAEAAARALFVYGGDAQLVPAAADHFSNRFDPINRSNVDFSPNASDFIGHIKSPLHSSTPQQQHTSPAYRNVSSPLNQQEQRPISTPPSMSPYSVSRYAMGPAPSGLQVQFSNRRNAMYLYYERIVGPLWQMKMCIRKQDDMIDSAFTSEELSWLSSQLRRFVEVIDKYNLVPQPAHRTDLTLSKRTTPTIASRPNGYIRNGMTVQANQELDKRYAVEAERESILELRDLTARSSEMLSLWKILNDHTFCCIVSQLPQDIRQLLADILFADLVKTGHNLCSDLITCLIRQYLGDQATTNVISERLRQACPGLYTSDDATVAKATEMVQQAKVTVDGSEKSRLLHEAAAMFKKIVPQLHMPTVCLQLQQAEGYEQIADLALSAAAKCDPRQIALNVYKNPGTLDATDVNTARIVGLRTLCYSCITDALDSLCSGEVASNRGKNIGSPSARHSEELAAINRELIIKAVLGSQDELAHAALFNWMLERSLSDKLLQSGSPYLETYLKTRAEQDGSHRFLDLLWRFYEKNGRYSHAARLLYKLADRHNTQTDLQQRLSYLSQAVVCAQSAPDSSSVDNADFLQELKDRLEVARMQNETKDALRQLRSSRAREAISKLEAELFDVTSLWEQFAEPFDLPQVKLSILHGANHYDQELTENIWKAIIDTETMSRRREGRESADVCSRRLASKMLQLSRIYAKSARFFPIDYLLRLLNRKSVECGFSPGWLPKVAKDLNIRLQVLLSALLKQYKSADPLWKQSSAQAHLMNTVLFVTEDVAETAMNMPSIDRRSATGKCLDVMAELLIDLEMPGTRGELLRVKNRIKTVQGVLERINAT